MRDESDARKIREHFPHREQGGGGDCREANCFTLSVLLASQAFSSTSQLPLIL